MPRNTRLDALKWLAMLSMTLDHLRFLWPQATWLFTLGRMAFPLFCVGIAANVARKPPGQREGGRYLLWLLVFAVLCEWPYRLLNPGSPTLNIMPTLALGLMVAWGVHHRDRAGALLAGAAILLAGLIHPHLMYGAYGVLIPAVLVLAMTRTRHWVLLAAVLAVLANSTDADLVQAWLGHRMQLSIGVIFLSPLFGLWWLAQPGAMPIWPVRRWGYFFYPLHLLLIKLLLVLGCCSR